MLFLGSARSSLLLWCVQMLEERELKEWALREEEMKKEQEARLQVLIDTLKARFATRARTQPTLG